MGVPRSIGIARDCYGSDGRQGLAGIAGPMQQAIPDVTTAGPLVSNEPPIVDTEPA